jgi:hypothetical protein
MQDAERLKQRIPWLDYLQQHHWIAHAAGRQEFVGFALCITTIVLPSTSMPAKICSTATAAAAAGT